MKIRDEAGFIICETDKLVGNRIDLAFPSVGATENIMLAAVFAEGETTISNAAKEPEILDLQNFLNSCGAKIKGGGTTEIVISGVKKLHDTEYTVMPDRIAAGTYLVAAAITKGDVVLNNIEKKHLYPITGKLLETGCDIKFSGNSVRLRPPDKLKAIDQLLTNPHPGFPTDMQPQFMTLMSLSEGTSIVVETMFESRNKHISELNRMGADIILTKDGMTSVIKGVSSLEGATVAGKDLRGGAALILAGLAAQGETKVLNSFHVERGYESIESALTKLGADIKLIS